MFSKECLLFLLFLLPANYCSAEQISNNKRGSEIYHQVCSTCHEKGLSAAPIPTDQNQWAARLTKGLPVLYNHVIEGFNLMPPKGGCVTCTTQDLKLAVDYMVQVSGAKSVAKPQGGSQLSFDDLMVIGKNKYQLYCAACHKENGSGTILEYPALQKGKVGSSFINIDKPIERNIELVLKGISGTQMMGFANQLNDTDIAAIITYTRNAWGNNTGDIVQPQDVQKVRAMLRTKPAADNNELTFNDAMQLGKEYYRAYCARCHQQNGEGRAPFGPVLKGSLLTSDPDLLPYRIKLVLYGAAGTRMKGFHNILTNREIAAILTYIGNSFGNSNKQLAQPKDIEKATIALQQKEKENNDYRQKNESELVAGGKIIYKAYCARCHKLDGSGGAQASVPPLKNGVIITTHPIADHIDIILTGIPGSIMRTFAGRLSDQEIAEVVTYERQQFGNKKDIVQAADVKKERTRLQTQINYQTHYQLQQQFLQDEKMNVNNVP